MFFTQDLTRPQPRTRDDRPDGRAAPVAGRDPAPDGTVSAQNSPYMTSRSSSRPPLEEVVRVLCVPNKCGSFS